MGPNDRDFYLKHLGLFYDMDLKGQLEKELFTDIKNQKAFSLEMLQNYWYEDLDIMEIQDLPLPNSNIQIQVSRDPYKGELTGYYETQINDHKYEDRIESQDDNKITASPVNSQIDENSNLNINGEKYLTKIPLIDLDIQLNNSDNANEELSFKGIDERSKILIDEMCDLLNLDRRFFSNTNDIDDTPKMEDDFLEENIKFLIDDELDKSDNEETEEAPQVWYKTVDIEEDFDIKECIPDMALDWKFDLDNFQKHAISHLELGHSVFVSAHTSAGKTVVAEYAIALSIRHMTRTIYTSPIKALSNQKFRDFRHIFTDVGLLTGDVQINPDASCLIMTTEILRSMLYMGHKIIKELEYIIFDEVHYINDADRGVVWEEVLILLPEKTKLVLLSATVPNAEDFASWIGKTKKQVIYICKTLFRPVPLQYSIYLQQDASSSISVNPEISHTQDNQKKASFFKFYNSNSKHKIDIEVIKKAQKQYNQKSKKVVAASSEDAIQLTRNSEKQYYLKLIRDLSQCHLLPLIIFVFSKAKINLIAELIQGSISLLEPDEAQKSESFFNKAILKLKKVDQNLPQIELLRSYIKNGYAIHHSGVLPILKELVEILFQLGYIKVLIATETFGMGVNMPARTVVFSSIEKFDGTKRRTLLPGEFTQMSGRAGRRGTDEIGNVLICPTNKVPDENILIELIDGDLEILKSKFKLTYRMILSLLRVEILKIEDVIKDSFLEFSSKSNLPQILKQLNSLNITKDQIDKFVCSYCKPDILKYFTEFSKLLAEFYKNTFMRDSKLILKWLVPGRLIYADCGLSKITPMILISNPSNLIKDNALLKTKLMAISFPKIPTCILYNNKKVCSIDSTISSHNHVIHKYMKNMNPCVSIDLSYIKELCQKFKINFALHSYVYFERISSFSNYVMKSSLLNSIIKTIGVSSSQNIARTNIMAGENHKDLKTLVLAFSQDINRHIRDSSVRSPSNSPSDQLWYPFAPVHLSAISGNSLKHYKQYNKIEELIFSNKFWHCEKNNDHLMKLAERQLLNNHIEKHKEILAKMEQLQYLPQYKKRAELLKFMDYIDGNNIVTLKGRVACEFCTHELLLTEMILSNNFKDMKPEVMAASLSSLVCEVSGKKKNSVNIKDEVLSNIQNPHLQDAIFKMIEITNKISQNQKKFNISSDSCVNNDILDDTDERAVEYIELLNFELCEVVYKWTKGENFSSIIHCTKVQEGIVVRCIQRLEELLRNLREAARIIGEVELFQKTDETITLIKRDIVFTASLYTE